MGRVTEYDATPLGLICPSSNQGSSCLPTLGFTGEIPSGFSEVWEHEIFIQIKVYANFFLFDGEL